MADKSIFELNLQETFAANDRLVVGNYANSDAEAITGQKLIQLLGEQLEAHGGVTTVTLESTSGLAKTYHINYVDGNYDAITINDGDYISSYAIAYKASSSGTTPPTGTWSSTPVTATDSTPYLWTRITLSKAGGGSNVVVYTIGYKGHDAPTISSQSVTYQVGESGTEAPTGTWSSSIPSATDTYPYLWTRTIVNYSSGTSTESYSVAPTSRLVVGTVTATALETGQSATATINNSQSGAINTLNFAFGLPKGAKGDTGDYIEPVLTYGTSTNPATEPANWYSDASSLSYSSGNYIWRKTEFTMHDAQTVQLTKKEIIGYIGQNGTGSGTVTQITFNNTAYPDDGTGNVTITVDADDVGAIADPSTKSNGQVLTYDSNSGKWVAANPSTGNVNTVNNIGVTQGTTNIALTASNIPASNNQSVQTNLNNLSTAVSNVVHVGTSAPSDSSVKLWLDTDEQGTSYVTSVNGASGAVVLDLDFDAEDVGAMPEWDLLWSNASPSSSFSSQTISLNLVGYKAVWVVIGSDAAVIFNSLMIPVGKTALSRYSTRPSGSNLAYVSRNVTTSLTGIIFGSCSLVVQGTTGSTTDNTYNIPYYIYGIKGFSN